MNAPGIVLNLVAWGAIFILARRIYSKQDLKPIIWKLAIVIFVGLFSFSINLPYMDQQIKLAILPLGVWVLYGIYSRKDEGKSWEKYRKYAWLGFFANFIFLAASLILPLVHLGIYPDSEISTYISDINKAKVIKTHPSAGSKILDSNSLLVQLDSIKEESIFSEKWYYEAFESAGELSKAEEIFPYQLAGTEAKWGSGFETMIFVEQDGKGILITTGQKQVYFRAEKTLLKKGE
ncbi:hypothetical protein [Mesobacillus selenatarsenatis]|uniref:Uncharacterized protein n=1 Tax=Mesobacillus selenatarsenatis (strain DSM 18680 / JCM 14380 / FERM P-15431 / SF-1) TaxID=1321606 RepID=A0A0A8X4I7_MESS1|nr:hypothetical protein [Mesobacillus selenatarsenatis]GAM13912.1 hypothetical protein SAMD00020551_2059 [Mesobacillus selenatarsenatis SF-1]